MVRKLLISGVLALLLAAPAAAETRTLMPGVTYERGVQFTPHGPVAIHIVRGPRPTGLYALRPTLSNEAIQGIERVTSMQKRLSPSATMVGVNGDFYADSGRPSGVLMRDNVVESPPYGDRSSTGVTPEGALDVRRIEFFGTWRGLGQRRTLNDLNQSPGANGISLFTRSYGPVMVPERHYFMMGDNRDNSQDSRYWGFLPRSYVKGKALFVYFSFAEQPSGLLDNVRWSRIFHQIH